MRIPRLATLHALALTLVVASLAAVFASGRLTPTSARSPDGPAVHEEVAAPTTYRRNRFGRPASHVWRYRQPFVPRDLDPVANNNPVPEPQPHRDRPSRVVLGPDERRAYVALPGTEAEPGSTIAVVDLAAAEVVTRLTVGRRPHAPFLHPGGRFIVVTHELSNYLSVIDTATDRVTGRIGLDYYAQGLAFSPDGRRATVAVRYLDQVLVVDLEPDADTLRGKVREIGGFDEAVFFGDARISTQLRAALAARGASAAEVDDAAAVGVAGINAVLRGRCGRCHAQPTGGFVAGPDPVQNFLSAIENSVPGDALASPLVRSVIPMSAGGYGDRRVTGEFHTGGALFAPDEPELAALIDWIEGAADGPGIRVGNAGSRPKELVLSPGGQHLFVGNTGTMDVAVVDVQANTQVGGIYLQNLANHLAVVPDQHGERDQLIVLSLGAGFGAPKARDPHGAETWDPAHPSAQWTVLRDTVTTDPYPLSQQAVMGPFDAVDGTWAFKMRDIQNDIVAIDLSQLALPAADAPTSLSYQLHASTYEAHAGWVRYTSDTAEATSGDIKGDIPPELQRVIGAFPEVAAVDGDRLFVSMSGTSELVEYRVRPNAPDPSDRLEPVEVYETGLRPIGVVVAEDRLVVVNELAETLSIIDRATGQAREVVVGDLTRPPLDTDAEKGELVVHTSVFSSDGDTSCLHCHYRDTGDGRGWGAAETVGQDRHGDLTPGGTLGIPQMRNIFAIQPFYFEGTHRLSEGQGADVNEPASSIDFDRPVWAGDFTHLASPVPPDERRLMHEELKERVSVRPLGDDWYPLEERRDAFIRHQSMRWIGAAYGLRDLYRFVAAWLGSNNHLLPNPFDREAPAVARGQQLFNDARVMCGECHAAPEFTRKDRVLANNDRRALPQLTTVTRRGASYTLAGLRAVDRANGVDELDLEPDDPGRVDDQEGSFTTMQLRGIFDRPPTFLHHGRARSLREVLCTPDHPALRRFRLPVMQGPEEARPGRLEVGMNETTGRRDDGALNPADRAFDTHGGTSHLSARQIDDLVAFVQSIP